MTNSIPRCCRTIDKVIKEITSIRDRVFACQHSDVPYAMIQPRMLNNFEYKIVCWNMKVMYIGKCKPGYGHAFAIGNTVSVEQFAEKALALLSERCPHAILNGLTRVDIFQTISGSYVVNEYESLEAVTYGQRDQIKPNQITAAMREYWYDVLVGCIGCCSQTGA